MTAVSRQRCVRERGLIGRLIGLKPKVYVCRDSDTGEWYRQHKPPLLIAGFYGNQSLPCMRCQGPSGATSDQYEPTTGWPFG